MKSIKIHHVITMYFTVWKPCILKNTNNLGKRNTNLNSRVCRLEVLIKHIWFNISTFYRDLKGCFSIFRIQKDSQLNNTKTNRFFHILLNLTKTFVIQKRDPSWQRIPNNCFGGIIFLPPPRHTPTFTYIYEHIQYLR